MSLRSVYHHTHLSEQHESMHIVVSITMGDKIMYFNAPMNLIDIATIVFVTHFRLTSEARPVDNSIE